MLEQSSHVIVLLFLSNYGKLVTVLFIEGKSIMPFIGHKGGKHLSITKSSLMTSLLVYLTLYINAYRQAMKQTVSKMPCKTV